MRFDPFGPHLLLFPEPYVLEHEPRLGQDEVAHRSYGYRLLQTFRKRALNGRHIIVQGRELKPRDHGGGDGDERESESRKDFLEPW
jgi:hypothetical protein